MQHLYTAEVTAIGGRQGKITAKDGNLSLDVRMPKELGGSGEPGTNPEQLFAAGYAACFDSALNLVARTKGVQHEGTEVDARVSIFRTEEGLFQLQAELVVAVKGVAQDIARELVQAAHQVCPYSRATRGNIDVTIKLR